MNADALFTSGSYIMPGDTRRERTENGSEYKLQSPCDCILI